MTESLTDRPLPITLLVYLADFVALSQLYQIRGRVGRSDVTAHAYLFYPDANELSPEARARLATLADHTEPGSGFAIAMPDLEIRGAGNLPRDEQAGPVAAGGARQHPGRASGGAGPLVRRWGGQLVLVGGKRRLGFRHGGCLYSQV